MKLSLKVVERLLGIKIDNALELTQDHIYEVESYYPLINIKGLVIAQVLEVSNHPESDHLHICKVNLGSALGIKQIVCGASNVASGQFVIVSPVGTVLPGGEIKAAVIRKVESNGMICSLRELGLEDKFIEEKYKNGIFFYNSDMTKQLGIDPLSVMELDANVIDYDLPPNRGDLLSAIGYAREIGALLGAKVNLKEYPILKNMINPPLIKMSHRIPYYSITKVSNITIADSPWWLKSALIASDIRPINNIVDISNYLMIRYGLPNHMFDASLFKTNNITIRLANDLESVVTLDGVTRKLDHQDVLICDNDSPVALAGIMGLENSMINEKTKDILIEFASFNKEEVALSAKRLNLHTDSALRFERGIDETLIEHALNECLYLLVLLASAKIGATQIVNNRKYESRTIEVPTNYFTKMIGKKIELGDILHTLKSLDFEHKLEADIIKIKVPLYRKDLKCEADILEEVLRFNGLNKITAKPLKTFMAGGLTQKQKRLRKIREVLSGIGLNEIVSYTLIKDPNLYTKNIEVSAVLSPLSEDHRYLRPTLFNGLVDTYNYNKSHGNNNINMFEIGRVFNSNNEKEKLGILLSGVGLKGSLDKPLVSASFSLLNGLLNRLLWEFNLKYTLEATNILLPSTYNLASFHPYRSANIIVEGVEVGFISEIIIDKDERVNVLELDLESLLDTKATSIKVEAVTKYPSLSRDIAFYIDKHVTNAEILALITQTGKKYLIDIQLFDIYTQSNQDPLKSMAYHLTFNDSNKTLEATDVDKLMKSIVNRLEFTYHVKLRQ
jgi:phenylalanyl-tRNA synthetase beta chain